MEVEYMGRIPEGRVFDKAKAVVCVGQQQLLSGLDAALEGKETGQTYTIPLTPELAFGKRDIKKMKIVPLSTFREHKVQPQPGLQINVDGEVGIVTQVSGGRIIVNFNHYLAGKEVVYELKILRQVMDRTEQIKAYLHSTMRIPEEKIKVEIQQEKAQVSLPVDLPEQITAMLGKKIAEVVKLQEVRFSTNTRPA